MQTDLHENNSEVELAVGQLYAAFYKLRQAKKYQEEYDAMGTIIDMLMQDRSYLRETKKVNYPYIPSLDVVDESLKKMGIPLKS